MFYLLSLCHTCISQFFKTKGNFGGAAVILWTLFVFIINFHTQTTKTPFDVNVDELCSLGYDAPSRFVVNVYQLSSLGTNNIIKYTTRNASGIIFVCACFIQNIMAQQHQTLGSCIVATSIFITLY